MYDKRFIDELRSRLTLSEVIGRRVKLTRSGREYKGCCPFHNEKTPSFYVNDEKSFFHCFGCGAHGDVVSFRMRHDNISFTESIETLAQEAGLALPARDQQTAAHYDHLQHLQQIMQRVTLWFEAHLQHPQNAFALRYVQERGLTDETIGQFRIGYAPNNWDSLREAMLAQNIALDDLIHLGLLRVSAREDKADKPYSFFRGRIIFPVTDNKGRVIAFGGRHLDAAFAGQNLTEKPPKYLNSAEHVLFNKSQVLYGLARARALVSPDTPLILVEGYMDVIALVQAGFSTAVAPLGTALTEEHMQLAWKVSNAESYPILCFDGDTAGYNAAYRAIDRLLPHLTAQRGLRLAFLPKGEDPDSILRTKGKQAMHGLLVEAMGIFDALWRRALQEHATTPEGLAAMETSLIQTIQKVTDPILQQNYRHALRDRMYHFRRSLNTPNKPYANKKQGGSTFASKILPQSIKKETDSEQMRGWKVILTTAINHPFLLKESAEQLGSVSIPDPDLDTLRQVLLLCVQENPQNTILTSENLKQILSSRGLSAILSSLEDDSCGILFGFTKPDTPADVALDGWKDVWMRMQLKTVAQDKSKLLQSIKISHSDDIADRLMALNQQEQQLLDDTP
jgi:DNA primase